jgi:putative toxin-antitoxin system antitoxin component (TIGR02293 family)
MDVSANDASFRLSDHLADPVAAVRKGLPYASYAGLRDALGVADEVLARALAVSERTLHRRRKQGVLASEESDRLLVVAGVYELAVRALDGEERAASWLSTPHALFGGETPLEHMDTLAGVEEVRTALYHLEYGMPA